MGLVQDFILDGGEKGVQEMLSEFKQTIDSKSSNLL